jgi:ribosomal protein S18 acetylase RimI-like enzyme
MTQIMIDYTVGAPETSYLAAEELRIVLAQLSDCDAVVALFGALHSYNASLDAHFALSDDWESLLRREFCETLLSHDHLWLLAKQGNRAVGLLIAATHTDSPMFRHRQWVEVEALYVALGYRSMGIAQRLLSQAYQWAEAQGLTRVQLYVTASNLRAQSVYTDQGFTVTQAIMRKSLRMLGTDTRTRPTAPYCG